MKSKTLFLFLVPFSILPAIALGGIVCDGFKSKCGFGCRDGEGGKKESCDEEVPHYKPGSKCEIGLEAIEATGDCGLYKDGVDCDHLEFTGVFCGGKPTEQCSPPQ